MNEHRNCTCPASKSGSFQIATDHYSRNFIPTGWKLEYTSLEQHEPQRFLYMTGWCLRCGGQDLQSGISIPDELSGDALLERIYREMEHYRPFEHRRSDGTYNRSLLGRAGWYMEQDDLTLDEKNAQFLKLFHEEDQRAVEDWICRNRAEEPYTVPRRDRKSTLLYAVLDRARANGDLREIEPIWDYYLPNKNEPLSPDKDSYLTNYAFSAVSTIDFGCEGIYVELFLEGQFDESGNDRCSIGTFKTLRDDAEACRLMGQLCGVLMYHTAKYVNENLHRYTPKRELEAELHRKSAVTESTSEDSRHA